MVIVARGEELKESELGRVGSGVVEVVGLLKRRKKMVFARNLIMLPWLPELA
jgi:hypothetical protein